jgi:serine/threonine protein kinase
MIHVEDNEDEFAYRTYHRGRNVKAKQVDNNRIFGDYYDLGDELGRGTQGVTYHSVERSTGRSLAAKIMTGTGPELRSRMMGELDIMNQLSHQRLVRLIDAYETKDSLTLVSELAGGGDLVDVVTRRPHVTESDIAYYIRQVLEGLGHMHGHGIAHLGLTPGDLFLTRPDGDELKIGDFGLARRIYSNKLASLDYGMPKELVSRPICGPSVSFPICSYRVFHLLEEKQIEILFVVYKPDRSISIRKPLATSRAMPLISLRNCSFSKPMDVSLWRR